MKMIIFWHNALKHLETIYIDESKTTVREAIEELLNFGIKPTNTYHPILIMSFPELKEIPKIEYYSPQIEIESKVEIKRLRFLIYSKNKKHELVDDIE